MGEVAMRWKTRLTHLGCCRALGAVSVSLLLASCGGAPAPGKVNQTESDPASVITAVPSGEEYAQDYIEISNVVAKFEPSQYAFVSLKVKNIGSRAVRNLELVVYFLDSADKVIHEAQQTLVVDKELPLKPGYVKQIRSSTTHPADSIIFHAIPEEWEKGRVSVEVKGLEFVDE